jgi:hypothetical protein
VRDHEQFEYASAFVLNDTFDFWQKGALVGSRRSRVDEYPTDAFAMPVFNPEAVTMVRTEHVDVEHSVSP